LELHLKLFSERELTLVTGQLGGYANSRIANSRTGHLADWSTSGLDN